MEEQYKLENNRNTKKMYQISVGRFKQKCFILTTIILTGLCYLHKDTVYIHKKMC
jgi:hypothetical protein